MSPWCFPTIVRIVWSPPTNAQWQRFKQGYTAGLAKAYTNLKWQTHISAALIVFARATHNTLELGINHLNSSVRAFVVCLTCCMLFVVFIFFCLMTFLVVMFKKPLMCTATVVCLLLLLSCFSAVAKNVGPSAWMARAKCEQHEHPVAV